MPQSTVNYKPSKISTADFIRTLNNMGFEAVKGTSKCTVMADPMTNTVVPVKVSKHMMTSQQAEKILKKSKIPLPIFYGNMRRD